MGEKITASHINNLGGRQMQELCDINFLTLEQNVRMLVPHKFS